MADIITDITLDIFTWDDIPATRYGHHTGLFSGSTKMGLLTIRTRDGVEGHAFLGSASRGADMDGLSLIHYLKPILMGQNPLDRERLYRQMYRKSRMTTLRAIGAADIALWDIAGKMAGLPIARLIGQYRDKLPAYASSAVLQAPEAYAEEAVQFRDDGWAAYKIHPPTIPADDIKVCEAVRKAVGDDYKIMLDATWCYDYPQALRVGKVIEGLGFYWYEDPLDEEDMLNYPKLRQQLSIPLMATEYSPGGLYSYAPWIIQQATDYLRGDVAVKAGITGILKAAHLAEAFKMNFEIHHGGNSLNNVANLHVAMAIPNTEFFEVLLPSGAQKYGLNPDIEIIDGHVHAIERPGLGADIDFDLIKAKTVGRLD
ncbi:mandelate racemase [Alphaproteobacteria bacterium]|jgi:L-alanine-DL-glutamate epimerase-like enolase superfamily enzyme|nr:mandelate racemase [Alphaproteobacteria bacterium]